MAACLAEQSFEIDRRKIQLDEPLKQLGEYTVPIKVHREVTAQVLLRIVKEGDEGVASDVTPNTAAPDDTPTPAATGE